MGTGGAEPLVQRRQGLRGVEVARQRLEEAVPQRLEFGRRVGAGGQAPPGLANPRHVGLRLAHRRLGEGERLAVVAGDQEHHHGLAAVLREHLVQGRDVAG